MSKGALDRYIDKLLTDYHYLDFRGVMQLERIVALELDGTFVPLKAVRIQAEQASPSPKSRGAGEYGRGDSDAELEQTPPITSDRERLLERWEKKPAGTTGGKAIKLAEIFREERQVVLLGDPGSGKTTLVKWLARTFALGPKAVKERLGLDEDLVPIVVPAAQYASARNRLGELPLTALISEREGVEVGAALLAAIEEGRAFVFADGLDEIPDAQQRIATARGIEACVHDCAKRGVAGSRVLVTSRIYGYNMCRIVGASHFQLAAFERNQIEAFVRAWTWGLQRALEPAAPRKALADKEAETLIHAIYGSGAAHHDSLRTFAENPLLLTILALVQRQYGTLPELRVKLFQAATRTLTESWNRARSLAGPIRVELEAERTMQLWEPVALWMHTDRPSGTAHRAEILEQLARGLVADGVPNDEALLTAESYLDTAARWACLLTERGPNVFGFMHQTFQEYLAARALVREATGAYEVLQRYFFLPRWHEVVLLSAGYVGAIQEKSDATSMLVDDIRGTSDILEPHTHRYLLLAAEIVADRVPVGAATRDATVHALIDACIDAHGDTEEKIADRIAALARESVSPDVLDHAARTLESTTVSSWEARSALCLLVGSTARGRPVVRAIARDDPDRDVCGLAASLLLLDPREPQTVELASKLEPIWWSAARTLERRAEQVIDDAVRAAHVQDALTQLLRHNSSQVRSRAAHTLQRAAALTTETQAGLVKLLRDKNANVRYRSAVTLLSAGVRAAEAQVVLVGLLQGRRQYRVARTLMGAGVLTADAQAVLLQLLRGKDPAEPVFQVLQSSGPLSREAEGVLLQLLQREEARVRLKAATALHQAGSSPTEAQSALVQFLWEDDPYLRLCAAETLQDIGTRKAQAQTALLQLLQEDYPFWRLKAAEALRRAGARTVEAECALVKLLGERDRQVRYWAAETLRQAGTLSAEAEADLVKLLRHRSPRVRLDAAEILGRAGTRTAETQRALVQLLRQKDSEISMRAARALRMMGSLGAEAVADLVRLLRENDPDLRLLAALVFGSAGAATSEARDALIEAVGQPAPLAAAAATALSLDAPPNARWLQTKRPPRLTRTPGKPLSVPAQAQKPAATLPVLLNRAIRPDSPKQRKAIEDLRKVLKLDALDERPPPIDGLTAAEILQFLEASPVTATLRAGQETHEAFRRVLVAVFRGRFVQFQSRRDQGADPDDEEARLVAALPAPLLVASLYSELMALAAPARRLALARLVALPFEPDDPEAGQFVEVLAALADDADAAERSRILAIALEARNARIPDTRATAYEAMAVMLRRLTGAERELALVSLHGGEDDESPEVRECASMALRLVSRYLTAGEAATVRGRTPSAVTQSGTRGRKNRAAKGTTKR